MAENPRVGSAVIVENSNDEILFIRRKNPPAAGTWALPGGGIQFGETIKEAAKREVKEETGFDVEVGGVVTAFEAIELDKNVHRVVIISKAKLIGGRPEIGDDVSDITWIHPKDLSKSKLNPISPYTLRNLRDLGYMK